MDMNSSLYENTMKKLEKAIAERGSIRSLADKLELNPSTVSRWFAEGRSPDFRGLSVILEYLGAQIIFQDEKAGSSEQSEARLVEENKRLVAELETVKQERDKHRDDCLRKEGAISFLKEQNENFMNQAIPQGQIKNVNSGYQQGITQEILLIPKAE